MNKLRQKVLSMRTGKLLPKCEGEQNNDMQYWQHTIFGKHTLQPLQALSRTHI